MRKNNQLTSGQRYRLWRWVEENKAAVIANSDNKVALLATNELGFSCSGNNILAAREEFGLRKQNQPASGFDVRLRLDRIEKALRDFGIDLPPIDE